MKNILREEYKLKRKNMVNAREKSKKAQEMFLNTELYAGARVIMLYNPIQNETDTSLIINKAFFDRKKVVFPVTNEKERQISPFYAQEKTILKKGAYNINEPYNTKKADLKDIDVIIVPGIVFDKNGNRIGFGKGYYDRFLTNTDAIKIGFCYDFQLIESIPAENYDIRMDYIVSETQIIKCK